MGEGVRIAATAIEALDTPRGPNAEEKAFFAKVAALVNAEAPDPFVAFNGLYGAIVSVVGGMPRQARHGILKHMLTHFRNHVAKTAAERHGATGTEQ